MQAILCTARWWSLWQLMVGCICTIRTLKLLFLEFECRWERVTFTIIRSCIQDSHIESWTLEVLKFAKNGISSLYLLNPPKTESFFCFIFRVTDLVLFTIHAKKIYSLVVKMAGEVILWAEYKIFSNFISTINHNYWRIRLLVKKSYANSI